MVTNDHGTSDHTRQVLHHLQQATGFRKDHRGELFVLDPTQLDGITMCNDRQPPTDVVYREEDLNTLPMPNTFFELLDFIREKPGMYLGRMSLRNLHIWLQGFRIARIQAGLPPLPDDDKFSGFDAFVCDKYRWHDVCGWAAKIEYYYQDDATALEQFFKLLDEFRALPAT